MHSRRQSLVGTPMRLQHPLRNCCALSKVLLLENHFGTTSWLLCTRLLAGFWRTRSALGNYRPRSPLAVLLRCSLLGDRKPDRILRSEKYTRSSAERKLRRQSDQSSRTDRAYHKSVRRQSCVWRATDGKNGKRPARVHALHFER